MKKRYKIIVTGNVQRVGFRNHAAQVADKLKVTGKAVYVNHDIMIEAEGFVSELETFVNWCRKGPEGAEIDSLELTETKLKNDREFEIVHGLVFSKAS